MTTDVVTTHAETELRQAAEIMFEKWFRHLPVVDSTGRVVGILSLRDLLTLVARGMPDTLQALTGQALVRDLRLTRVGPGDLD